MGYLNITTRILDAILTKKGREILSSGGDFDITKFALGDDEIDYALWDTAHTKGTDYYGAVIDNLPALEPFNDPSEIMKYKLVSRGSENFQPRAMINLIDGGGTATNLAALLYYKNPGQDNAYRTLVQGPAGQDLGVSTKLGGGPSSGNSLTSTAISVGRTPNRELVGSVDFDALAAETYTVTILDSSVAILAPAPEIDNAGGGPPVYAVTPESSHFGPPFQPAPADRLWLPFVDNVQHISQTVAGCVMSGGNLSFPQAGTINYNTGQIVLTSFNISSVQAASGNLEVTLKPDSNDVVPVRNQVIEIDTVSSVTSAEIDTFATGEATAGVGYASNSSTASVGSAYTTS